MSDEVKPLTIDDLKRMFEQGTPVTLISGVQVQMRTPRPQDLLASGKLPDILTPIVLKSLYENASDKLDEYLFTERDEVAETLEMVRGVDAVCEAALVEPSILPYLDLSDRMWIFRLAFMPVQVLGQFRQQPGGNVESKASRKRNKQPTERAAVRI